MLNLGKRRIVYIIRRLVTKNTVKFRKHKKELAQFGHSSGNNIITKAQKQTCREIPPEKAED